MNEKTVLALYDTTGYIYSQYEGDVRVPIGIPSMSVIVPDGKWLASINVTTTPHTPIFEDYPKSEIEVIKEKAISSEEAIDDLTNMLIMISMK